MDVVEGPKTGGNETLEKSLASFKSRAIRMDCHILESSSENDKEVFCGPRWYMTEDQPGKMDMALL